MLDPCARTVPRGQSSWASVWPAAAGLAALLTASPEIVRGKRVVELGSGLGVRPDELSTFS